MRILALSNCQLRPTEGSGQIILALTEGLRECGHEIDLHGPDDYEVGQWMRPRANTYRQTVGMLRFATRALERKPYDLLEIYGGDGWLTFAWLARKRSRPYLVSHSNGLEPHHHRTLARAGMANRRWWQLDQAPWMVRAFKIADGLITLSDFDRRFAIEERYQPPERVVTVRPGLHPRFHSLPLELERPPVIGFCGSWLPNKGIDLIRVALPEVLRTVPEARALLVGVGRSFVLSDWFPSDVAKRIEAVPWVDDRAQLVQLYRRMAIALMPSFYESFGLVAGEAMACSAAVVASQTTGIGSDLEGGHNAVLLARQSPECLRDAIVGLLKDEPFRRRVAEAGHRHAALLRWEASTMLLDSTYRAWFAESRRPTRQSDRPA